MIGIVHASSWSIDFGLCTSAYSAVRACDANAYGTTPNTSSPTLNRVDAFADRRHDAGRFDAQRHDRVLDAGIQAERLEHVAEVEAGRVDFDFDLARPRAARARPARIASASNEPACVMRSWNGPRGIDDLRRSDFAPRRSDRRAAHEPGDKSFAVAIGDFAVVRFDSEVRCAVTSAASSARCCD